MWEDRIAPERQFRGYRPFLRFDESLWNDLLHNVKNFGMTVEYCSKHLHPAHLIGFLQTPWRPTLEEFRQHHMQAIEQVGAAIASFK